MSNPATAVQQRSQPKKDIKALIQSDVVKAKIAQVLPKYMTADRMAMVMMTAVTRTPKLLECSPESLLQAMMVCSQAGLEPDGRYAHLIPYGTTVQVIFDYKGIVHLAEMNGVEHIYADKVCDNDSFDAWVDDGVKKLNHKIDFKKPRGNAYAYYVSCRRAGRLDYEVMTKEEVDKIRSRSRAANSGPWVTDYDEMAKKTVIRRMSKRWDLTVEVAESIVRDDDTPTDIAKKPGFAEDPFNNLPEVTASAPPEQENRGSGSEKGNTDDGDLAPTREQKPVEQKPAAEKTATPKKEPAKKAPPQEPPPAAKEEKTEEKQEQPEQPEQPAAQDTKTPEQAIKLALDLVGFKKADTEDDGAVFKRFFGVVNALLNASGVTEAQFMNFCRKNQLAKPGQRMNEMAPKKFVQIAQTWGTVLPEILKEPAA